jgi:hypothetical protein
MLCAFIYRSETIAVTRTNAISKEGPTKKVSEKAEVKIFSARIRENVGELQTDVKDKKLVATSRGPL